MAAATMKIAMSLGCHCILMDSLLSLTRLGRSVSRSRHPADYRCSILGRRSRFRTNGRAVQRFWEAPIFRCAIRKPKELNGETTKCREEPAWHLAFRKTA